jgi:EAL domain-containing protein (putative c-di-GMP-specific phosphodiesterase class I)
LAEPDAAPLRSRPGNGRVAPALDDFGASRSSLRLWSELKPEIVKIDKDFTRHLSQHAEKLQTRRALLQISQTPGRQPGGRGHHLRRRRSLPRPGQR